MLCLIDFTHSDGKEKMYAIGIPQLHVKKKKKRKGKKKGITSRIVSDNYKAFPIIFYY